MPRQRNAAPSPAELAALRAAVRYGTVPMAAAQLGVARATVRAQLNSLYRKLEVGNRTEATTTALRLGLLRPDELMPVHQSSARPTFNTA